MNRVIFDDYYPEIPKHTQIVWLHTLTSKQYIPFFTSNIFR